MSGIRLIRIDMDKVDQQLANYGEPISETQIKKRVAVYDSLKFFAKK